MGGANRHDRERLGGYVSAEAKQGWDAFASRHGVDLTALLEVIGRHLGRGGRLPREAELLTEARAVMRDRHSRAGTRGKWFDG